MLRDAGLGSNCSFVSSRRPFSFWLKLLFILNICQMTFKVFLVPVLSLSRGLCLYSVICLWTSEPGGVCLSAFVLKQKGKCKSSSVMCLYVLCALCSCCGLLLFLIRIPELSGKRLPLTVRRVEGGKRTPKYCGCKMETIFCLHMQNCTHSNVEPNRSFTSRETWELPQLHSVIPTSDLTLDLLVLTWEVRLVGLGLDLRFVGLDLVHDLGLSLTSVR